MRLWQNDATETKVTWFRAFPAAKLYSKPHRFLSSIWDEYKHTDPSIGEQGSAHKAYGKGPNDLGLLGRNVCGSVNAWMNGGIHGVDEAITVGHDGKCACCEALDQRFAMVHGVGFRMRQNPLVWRLYLPADSGLSMRMPVVQSQQVGVGTGIYLFRSPKIVLPLGVKVGSRIWPQTYFQSLIGVGSGTGSNIWPQTLQPLALGTGTAVNMTQGGVIDLVKAWVDLSISTGPVTTINGSLNIGSAGATAPNFLQVNFATGPSLLTAGVGVICGVGLTAGNPIICEDGGIVTGSQTFRFIDAVTQLPDLPTTFKAVWAW